MSPTNNGWPNEPGVPLNPEQDSEGHVIRMADDGNVDVYRWDSGHQWFEDRHGRWIASYDIAKDGDEYLGQIITTAHHAASLAAEARGREEACAGFAEGLRAGLRRAAMLSDDLKFKKMVAGILDNNPSRDGGE